VPPLLTRIDHIGIACRDLQATVGLYEATFGLTVVSFEVNEEQGVREAMLRTGGDGDLAGERAEGWLLGAGPSVSGIGMLPGGYVQLLEPLGPDTPVGRFLARRGEGIHHVGYGVSDVRQALSAIGATGVRLLDERPRHGSMGASIAFLHPADLGGVLTELVESPRQSTTRHTTSRRPE
jgi:methylmalonyl-CoA/ethylmalonyl-CoA epimerase